MAKKKIKVRRPGLLGGEGYTSKPARERRAILRQCIEQEGVVTCQRALLAMQSWSSSGTWAPKKRKAVLSDLEWISNQLPNEPAARAAERLRRSLSKGRTMSKALGSAKSRVARISDPDKLTGAAMYFSGPVHSEYDLSDTECRKALEVAEAATEKLMAPKKKKKKATKKKAAKKSAKKKGGKKRVRNPAEVVNMFGESLAKYPRLPISELRRLAWDRPIAQGHWDNLVFEGDARQLFPDTIKDREQRVRVWRSRMTRADGMPCDDLVTVEVYRGPDWIWEKIDEYCPRTGRSANPGVVEPRSGLRGLKSRLMR